MKGDERRAVSCWAEAGALKVGVLALAGLLIAVPAAAVERVVDVAGVPCISGAPVYTTIDAAVMAALPGETILVCAGTYYISDWVDIWKADLTLRAQGIVRVTGAPPPGSGSGSPAHFGFVVSAEGVTIEGFEMSWFLYCAIEVHADRVDIRGNRLHTNPAFDAAICVYDPTSGHRIRYNVFEGNTGGGILFRAGAGEISNNTVIGWVGIRADNCGFADIHHNVVTGRSVGIHADNCDAVSTNNTVRGSSVAGIRFTGASFAVIGHNAVRDSGTGVLLDDAHVVAVSFNSIAFNDTGLDVKNSDDVTATGNNVSRSTTIDCRWDGIGANVLADNNCGTQTPPGAFD